MRFQFQRVANLLNPAINAGMKQAIATGFAPLIGLPSWNVDRVHGSMLSLQFGSPHLRVREPIVSTSSSARVRQRLAQRRVTPFGEWNLVISYCRWRFCVFDEPIAGDADPHRKIDAAASALDGQKLIGFTLDAATRMTSFVFDLGASLTTWPDANDNEEQWLLYQPGDHAISYRADGHYSSELITLQPGQETWLPMECNVELPYETVAELA